MSAKYAPNQLEVYGYPLKLHFRQGTIDVTSDRSSPNPRWRHTDDLGHDHYYDHGYPTLNLIIDEQHWCDGTEGVYNHDPHWAVDEAHYECKLCGQVVEPGLLPAGTPQFIPGVRTIEATVYGDVGESFEFEYGGEMFEFERVGLSSEHGASVVGTYLGRLKSQEKS